MFKLFVYGTLKRGFPLHGEALHNARFEGPARTVEAYPMVIGGPWFGPMMFDQPGVGLNIRGELFLVDEADLPLIDRAENIGEPGNERSKVAITSEGAGQPFDALVYTKAQFLAEPRHSGYLADYQDRRFIPPWERPDS